MLVVFRFLTRCTVTVGVSMLLRLVVLCLSYPNVKLVM